MKTNPRSRCNYKYLAILSFIITGLLIPTGCLNSKDIVLSTNEPDLIIVTQTYPTELIVYGDDLNLDPACHVRKIDAITEENLKMDDAFQFFVLVINDINENAPISDDELKLIISIVDQGSLSLYYFGKRLINPIISEGNYITDIIDPYEDMSIARVHEPHSSLCVLGVWTDEMQKIYETQRPDIFQEVFLGSVVRDVIKPNSFGFYCYDVSLYASRYIAMLENKAE